jgi:chromosome partitioning protein
MASTVVAICNQKGGVGKTTTTISLGAALVERGRKVLLIDLDPQGSLTISCGIDSARLSLTVYNMLCGRTTMPEILHELNGLDIAPANIDLAAAEVELVNALYREEALRSSLQPFQEEYDYIFIDCPPSLGLLTINAMVAADSLLIPVECEYLALRGLGLLYQTYERIKQYNAKLTLLGFLPCLYDSRSLHAREVLARIQELGSILRVQVMEPVRRSIRFAEATLAGRSILDYADSIPGAETYRRIAEVIDHA